MIKSPILYVASIGPATALLAPQVDPAIFFLNMTGPSPTEKNASPRSTFGTVYRPLTPLLRAGTSTAGYFSGYIGWWVDTLGSGDAALVEIGGEWYLFGNGQLRFSDFKISIPPGAPPILEGSDDGW